MKAARIEGKKLQEPQEAKRVEGEGDPANTLRHRTRTAGHVTLGRSLSRVPVRIQNAKLCTTWVIPHASASRLPIAHPRFPWHASPQVNCGAPLTSVLHRLAFEVSGNMLRNSARTALGQPANNPYSSPAGPKSGRARYIAQKARLQTLKDLSFEAN